MEDGDERLLDLNGEFALANVETALELRKRNVVQQLQYMEWEAAFAARVQRFEEVSRNLGSTTSIEVTSMLTVSLKLGEAEAYCMLLATCMHVDTT